MSTDKVPAYVILESEAVFAAPIERVWKQATDYSSWQDYNSLETVAGELGKVGEVVRMDKVGVPLPFYGRTVQLDPPRRIMWKIYPLEGTHHFGFVDYRFEEVEGGTRLSVSGVYEYLVPEDEADEFSRQKSSKDALAPALKKLKKLVEDPSS
jgi:uncharacterized protein YndB with AHSA1/START domain